MQPVIIHSFINYNYVRCEPNFSELTCPLPALTHPARFLGFQTNEVREAVTVWDVQQLTVQDFTVTHVHTLPQERFLELCVDKNGFFVPT